MSVPLRNLSMATNLTDFIKCYDGLATKTFCDAIIESYGITKGQYLDREQRPSFHELNISQRYIAKDPQWMGIQMQLTSIFTDAVQLYIQDLDCLNDFPLKYAFEENRLKLYDNNAYDQFKDHVDVQDYSSARRFLVCFLYLNKVSEGGETNFPRLDYAIKPECGRILIFPPTWQYRHAGLPPVSDKKYIIGTYLHYL